MLSKILLAWLLSCSLLAAQSLQLRAGDGRSLGEGAEGVVAMEVGDELILSVRANLAAVRAAGISFYLALPAGFFALDYERPFVQGALFAGAVEFANEIMAPEKAVGIAADTALLSYAAVMGPGEDRGRVGSGEVVRLALRSLRSGTVDIAFLNSAIYAGKLVAEDGVGEHFFRAVDGLKVQVRVDQSGKAAAERGEGWAIIKRRVLAP